MSQVKRFGIYQTAKFSAALYFIVTAIMMIPLGFMILATDIAMGDNLGAFGAAFGMGFLFIIPFIYAVISFVMVAISCLIYNGVAHCVGGIEIEIEE